MVLAEAREVSRAALDVDDGLGVARREGAGAAGVGEHADGADTAADTARKSQLANRWTRIILAILTFSLPQPALE
eukprot:scaffold59457_cov61-Phaeocystis_antarctica.AAC.3